jgi:hypothetical protein
MGNKDIRIFPETEVSSCDDCPGCEFGFEVEDFCRIGHFDLDGARSIAKDGMNWSMPDCEGKTPAIDPRCPLKKKE